MSARYLKNPLTAGRIIDGLAFVVTPDNNRLHTLNLTATHLWTLAKEGCTAEEVAADLAKHYKVDEETALCDVMSCIDDMLSRQILVTD